jgi:hypothetical protein
MPQLLVSKVSNTYLSLPFIPLKYHLVALREAVAKMYNETYRKGMKSQYTFENVCIVPGGRSGLSRVAAVVGDVYGTFLFSPNMALN